MPIHSYDPKLPEPTPLQIAAIAGQIQRHDESAEHAVVRAFDLIEAARKQLEKKPI